MEEKKQRHHRVYPTSDPKSMFNNNNVTPEIVLERLGRPRYLLSSSSKVEKSRKYGYLTRILYLSSSVYCSHSTPSCRSLCLGFASGRMGSDQATAARDRRTALYAADTRAFLDSLREDLHHLCHDAETQGLKAACRINGSSDIPIEILHPEILQEWSGRVAFYDYTKVPSRIEKYTDGLRCDPLMWPWDYSLTFSASENTSVSDIKHHLGNGVNVAVVFWPDLPESYFGYPVIDGTEHDLRFLDPQGCIVGLKALGVARKDLSGFVVQLDRPSAGERLNIWNAA